MTTPATTSSEAAGLAGATKSVEVAAAVLLRGDLARPEFLLAQRPPGKPYAGYWEFPGGKVEAGESAGEALARELREELGILPHHAWPWVCREFTYPHARVRLRFFRVPAWQGEIRPLEHRALAWLQAGEAPHVAPILPANGPILRALALPPLYVLTNAEERGVTAELERVGQALHAGVRCLQLRDKALPRAERQRFAHAVAALTRAHADAVLLINDDLDLAQAVGASGVHLSSGQLWQIDHRPPFGYVGASCHDASDLARAAQLALDFVVLGPVLPTASHPGVAGIGWPAFARLAAASPLPVYALGGMQPGMLATAYASGAHGIAMLRAWQ